MEGEDQPAEITAAEEVAPAEPETLTATEEEPLAEELPAEQAPVLAEEVAPEEPETLIATEEEPLAEELPAEQAPVLAEEVAPEEPETLIATEEAPAVAEEGANAADQLVSEITKTSDSADEAPKSEQVAEQANPAEEAAPPAEPAIVVTEHPHDLPEVQEAQNVHVEGQEEPTTPEPDRPPTAPQPASVEIQEAPYAVHRQPVRSAGLGGVPPRPSTNDGSQGAPLSHHGVESYGEQDVGSVLAGDIMPAQFRRGFDNSHINRMSQGSYSRYLLSSDVIPEDQLYASFLYDLPVPGYMPFRGEHAADLETRRGNTRATSQRGNRNNQPGRYPGDNLSSTMGATMSSTIRREMEILDEPMYNELGAQRARRRRDPEHCVEPTVTDQHYYNQKSKAYFVPQDQNPSAAMLQYNHLYDFGNGSRFKSGPGESARRNPHAPPPRTYAENKQAAAAIERSRPPSKGTGSVANRRREEIEKGSSSLRTAKAVDVQKLHCSQFRQTRSIEDVIASDPTYVARSTDGIRAVVDSGKMDWSELPNRLQTVMSSDRYKKRPTSSGRLYAPYRPPQQSSPVSVPGKSQQTNSLPPLHSHYEVSRISFTKRYEPNATPSAFIDKKAETLEPLS